MSLNHIERSAATRTVTATVNPSVTWLFALSLCFPHVRLDGPRTLWEQKVPGSSPGPRPGLSRFSAWSALPRCTIALTYADEDLLGRRPGVTDGAKELSL